MTIWDKLGHPLGGEKGESYTPRTFKRTEVNAPLHAFLRDFLPSKHNLYMSGPVGCGKTHAATALALHFKGRVVKPYQIMQLVRWTMGVKGIDEGDIISLFAGERVSVPGFYGERCPLLVIDDLGTEKLTEFAETTLFSIIDARVMADAKGLVVTSNLTLDALAERMGSDRIPSRLAAMSDVFKLDGEKDWRVTA